MATVLPPSYFPLSHSYPHLSLSPTLLFRSCWANQTSQIAAAAATTASTKGQIDNHNFIALPTVCVQYSPPPTPLSLLPPAGQHMEAPSSIITYSLCHRVVSLFLLLLLLSVRDVTHKFEFDFEFALKRQHNRNNNACTHTHKHTPTQHLERLPR